MRPNSFEGWPGGDQAVDAEGDHAGTDPGEAAVLSDALPHEPGDTDLGQGGEDELGDGADCAHARNIGIGRISLTFQSAGSSGGANLGQPVNEGVDVAVVVVGME